MKLQKLFSLTRQAVDDHQMIAEGDRIAIGISGGKDSLTLLYALQGLQKFYPHHFELEAVTVDLGYPGFDLEPIRELCQKLQVPYTVVPTQISKIVFEERHEHISHWAATGDGVLWLSPITNHCKSIPASSAKYKKRSLVTLKSHKTPSPMDDYTLCFGTSSLKVTGLSITPLICSPIMPFTLLLSITIALNILFLLNL